LIRDLAGEDLYSPGQALAPPTSRITAQKDAGGSEEVFENGDDGSEPTFDGRRAQLEDEVVVVTVGYQAGGMPSASAWRRR
jgi:hypothetical protein